MKWKLHRSWNWPLALVFDRAASDSGPVQSAASVSRAQAGAVCLLGAGRARLPGTEVGTRVRPGIIVLGKCTFLELSSSDQWLSIRGWRLVVWSLMPVVVRSRQSDVTTTTVRRGLMYDVTVNTSLATALLSLQTVFSCTMLIPGTQFSLKEDTMYLKTDIRWGAMTSCHQGNSDHLRTSASHVYSRGRVSPALSLGAIIVTGTLLRKMWSIWDQRLGTNSLTKRRILHREMTFDKVTWQWQENNISLFLF